MRKIYSVLTCLAFVLSALPALASDSCRADFERIPVSSNNPLTAAFRAQPWHNENKKPEQICWHFGDGQDTCINYDPLLSNNYVVSHTYSHPGVYNVCVRIRYQGGCVAEKCREIIIVGEDSCRADFETSAILNHPLGKKFTAIPWHNQNKKPISICWQFGDGNDTCIQYGNTFSGPYTVNHVYANAGQYEACVRIVYEGGCDSRKCRLVTVLTEDSCRADFERIGLTATSNPLNSYFRALPWHSQNKKPRRICWEFGDGKDTCIEYPENYTGNYVVGHHYDHTGNYQVCVKINYFGGCEARKCKTISIFNIDPCRVHIFENASSISSLTREFYFTSSPGSGTPKRICWKFGDGTDTCIMVDSNATQIPNTITHTFPAPGIYHTCIRVLYWSGCVAEDCNEVAIRRLTNICGGYFTDSMTTSHSFDFKGYSIHNPNDAVVGYRWTFGDGTTAVGQHVTHNYASPGIYRVCLLVNTEKGCEAKICNSVRVAGTTQSILQLTPNPVINILHVLFYSSYTEPVNIKIINSSGIVVRTYSRNAVIGANNWDFDAGNLLPGVYSVVVYSGNQFASGVFMKQ